MSVRGTLLVKLALVKLISYQFSIALYKLVKLGPDANAVDTKGVNVLMKGTDGQPL